MYALISLLRCLCQVRPCFQSAAMTDNQEEILGSPATKFSYSHRRVSWEEFMHDESFRLPANHYYVWRSGYTHHFMLENASYLKDDNDTVSTLGSLLYLVQRHNQPGFQSNYPIGQTLAILSRHNSQQQNCCIIAQKHLSYINPLMHKNISRKDGSIG